MKKRLILLSVLCLLFVLSVALSACGNSDTNNESGDNKTNTVVYLPYDIDETGTIKRFYANESNGANIVIPAAYSINENGRIIVGTACEIKSIGAYCFANNNLIETVSVPDTIVSIQEKAFFNCAKLKSINVCKNITSIGADAFEECPQLTTVTRHGTDGLKLEKNTNLSVFSIPDTITKIDNEAFEKWEELTTITVDENVKYVGDNAFAHCKNLDKIRITSSLDFCGNAFDDCEKLTSLSLSAHDGSISFEQPQSVDAFIVPDSVTYLPDHFFYGWTQLEEVTIPETVPLSGMIFKDNNNLTSLTCGSSNILSLFYNTYGSMVESENMYVVTRKQSMSSYFYNYYIPNTLREVHLLGNIDSACMSGMKSVEELHIESDVTSFGAGAFSGCSGLTNVYFSTDGDWEYTLTVVTTERGTISKAVMNNPRQLAEQLKKLNSDYHLYKL